MRIVSIGLFAPDYLIALANALAKSGDVTLFLSRQNLSRYFHGHETPEGLLRERHLLDTRVTLRLLDYPNGQYLRKPAIMRDLAREIERIDPDIVHYQSGGDPWILLALRRLRKFPLVSTIHDAQAHPGGATSPLSQFLKNLLISRLSQQVIVHGKQQAEIMKKTYRLPAGSVNVVPIGGYDLFTGFNGHHITPEPHSVLFFGSLRASKGIDIFLRAVPLIAGQVPDAHFIVAGAGDCPAVHGASAQRSGRIEVHNRFIDAEEVPVFFERSALVVLPYLEASQSGVLPLAYLFHRPGVATRVGSIPEVVDEGVTGLLVDPGDEQALAQAVVRVLRDDRLRETMGQAAGKKLERDLSWDAIAEKTGRVYEHARAARRPRVVLIGPGASQIGGVATFNDILLSSPYLRERYELLHLDTTRGKHGYGLASRLTAINMLYFLRQALELFRLKRTRHPRILHLPVTSSWSFWKDAAFILIARFLRMKVAAHLHGGMFDRYYLESPRPIQRLIGWSLSNADVVIALSEYWKRFLLERIRPDLNVEVVPNTIDHRFAQTLDASVERQPIVLFVGGLGKRKGVYDILKAVPLVTERLPQIQFVFAGAEEVSGEWEKIQAVCAENDLGTRVQFLGNVTGQAKLDLFQSASIFILPSHGENLPYALLEAMACGLPVVTTPVGAIPEIVTEGRNGFLIQPGDYRALAERIIQLWNDPSLRTSMDRANRERIRGAHLPEATARKFDVIYARLLKGGTT